MTDIVTLEGKSQGKIHLKTKSVKGRNKVKKLVYLLQTVIRSRLTRLQQKSASPNHYSPDKPSSALVITY